MTRILFLCNKNSSMNLMAEAFTKLRNDQSIEAVSASITEFSVDPVVLEVMKELDIDLSNKKSINFDKLHSLQFDLVVYLDKQIDNTCPTLPGRPEVIYWNIDSPPIRDNNKKKMLPLFRKTRDLIKELVNNLFERGYLNAIVDAKTCAELVIDNIFDGLIAHDSKRQIFYFNKAAEKITGYSREEVLNHDCHDIFPGNFCGAKCRFCDEQPIPPSQEPYSVNITTKTGEKRTVTMVMKEMTDANGKSAGILATFHDMTNELRLSRKAKEINQFSGIIGRDHKMLEIFDLIRDLADSSAPVMIQGESGTGKELIATAIHNEGPRANKLFVPVNCGALPESLLESELFGHVKGSFTGAIRDKKGRFELADGGTIFLDEIGDISPAMQVRMLRVLQEGTFERVGSETTLKVDVRIISATNKNLAEEIQEGRFREDIFYRLAVVPVRIPPLRERLNDIPLLVDHILQSALNERGRKETTISQEVLDIMLSHSWPGNIRELQNWIQFALIKCKGDVIKPEHLPPTQIQQSHENILNLKRVRKNKITEASIREALTQTNGNKAEAAKVLGVSRATLYRFIDNIADN